MLNFKISGIAAGAAFILSLLFGLFSGSGILVLLVRALIFAAVFFGLSCLIMWLLAQYLPELLNPSSEDSFGIPSSGSRIDISVGDGKNAGAFPLDNSETVDDIRGRPSAAAKPTYIPLDQKENAGYNEVRKNGGDLDAADRGEAGEFGSNAGMFGGGDFTEALPDMDSITESMPGSTADAVGTGGIDFDSPEPRQPKSSSKVPDMAGNFDPKELAQAIQTVLKRDQKG